VTEIWDGKVGARIVEAIAAEVARKSPEPAPRQSSFRRFHKRQFGCDYRLDKSLVLGELRDFPIEICRMKQLLVGAAGYETLPSNCPLGQWKPADFS